MDPQAQAMLKERSRAGLESAVISTQQLTPTVRAIHISKPPGFKFEVSQAVRLILPAAGGGSRLLSIASAPTRDYLEFAVRISSSRFKEAFAELRPGDPVAITSPRGRFPFSDDRPAVFVAGGVGITPLKSMAEYAHDLKLKTPIVLVYGNRSPEEIAFRAQLDELQAANPYFRIVYTVSKSDRTWPGRVGRITPNLLEEVADEYERPLFYLAGPPTMVVRSVVALMKLRTDPEQIRFEVFRGYP